MRSGFLVRVISSFTVLTLCAQIASAADGKPPTPLPDNVDFIGRLKSTVDDLNLTGDIKSKVDDILGKAKEEADKVQSEAGDDRRAAYGKTSDIMRSAAVQIMTILDEDQKLLFQSKMRAAAAAGATANTNPPATLGQRIKDALAPLKLSDEQNKKADAVIEDLQKKAEEIRSAGIGPEIPQKLQALRQEGLKQFKAILTEEQFGKFQENIAQAAQSNAPTSAEAGSRILLMLQRIHDATKDVGLTAEQQTKVDASFARTKEKFADLIPQLKTGVTPEFGDKMRAIFQDLRQELGATLTPEQLEKMKSQMQQQKPATPASDKK